MSKVIGAVFKIKDHFSGQIEKIIGAAKKSENAIKQADGVIGKFGSRINVKPATAQVDGLSKSVEGTKKAVEQASPLISARVAAIEDSFKNAGQGVAGSTKLISARVEAINESFKKSEQESKKASNEVKGFGQGFKDKISSKLKEISGNAKQSEKAFNDSGGAAKKFGDNASGGFQKAVGGAKSLVAAIGITKALSAAFDLVKGSLDSAFNRIDTMESFERVMTTLTGSTKKTEAALKATSEAVTGTAYGMDVAAKGVQDFVTRGMDVNKATDVIAAWGDAVAFYGDGSNEQLARVSDALAKMTSKGKVDMDQMNTLFDAGIDGVGMYAKATDKSTEEVQKALSSGEISAENFIDTVTTAMMEGTNGVENISGAAKDAGASWGASFDNMKAAVSRGTISVIQSIDEMLTSNGLPDMREMVSMFGKKFEEVLKGAAEKVPDLVSNIQDLYGKLQENGAIDIAKSALDGVKETVVLFKDAIILAKDNMNLLLPVVAGVAGAIGAMKVIGVVSGLYALWTSGTIAQTVAQWALNGALSVSPLTWIVLAIGAVIAIGVALWMNWDTVKAKALELWSSLTERFNSIKESVGLAVENTKIKVTTTWENIKTSVSEKVESMRQWVSDKFQAIRDKATDVTDWVKDKWNSVIDVFKNVGDKVSDMADSVVEKWNSVKTFLKNPIKGTVNLVQTGSVSGDEVGENYRGTSNWKGGLTTLHEKGDEVYDLPGGTRIYPHSKSLDIARNRGRQEASGKSSKSKSIEIIIAKLADQIIVREEADIDKIAKEIVRRVEKANLNMA